MDEKTLIGILVIVLLFGVAAFYIHNNGPPEFMNKLPLVEEYSESEIVVVEQSITPSPGSVWKLEQTPSGLMFKQLDSKLVEELQLDNVTLAGGDIISWHGSDWYVYSCDDYVEFDKSVDIDTTSSSWGWTIVASFKVNGFVNAGDMGWYYAEHPVAVLYDHWGGAISLRDSGSDSLYPVVWIANWGSQQTGDSLSFSNDILFVGSGLVVDSNNTKARSIVNGISYGEYNSSVTDNRYGFSRTVRPEVGNHYIYHYLDWQGRIHYAIFYDNYELTTTAYNEAASHIINNVPWLMTEPTWYNGTHYIALDGTIGTAYGNIKRVPAETIWLWLIKSATTDTSIHIKFMPPGTILKLKDTITGQTWQYTVTGVQNQAGLIEDYTITPPTSNPVDITAYIPSERIRFYAPDGFTIKISDSTGVTTEKPIDDGKVTLAGGTTVKLVAQEQEQLYMQLDETPNVYRIIISRNDGTPVDAYVWIYDDNGNLVDYGNVENGVYELTKTQNLPDGIRVEAKALDAGIYYTGSKDFRLSEEETVTVVPNTGLLSNNNFAIALAAAIFLGMVAIAIIVRGR